METILKREEKLDKSWNEEDYIGISEYQNSKLSQKDIEYTELLCWLLEQKNWEYDLTIIKGEHYDAFMNSDDEVDMKMKIIEAKDFYKEFRKISNVDIMDESCFISMTYIDDSGNDVNLIVNDNGINKRYIIGIVG